MNSDLPTEAPGIGAAAPALPPPLPPPLPPSVPPPLPLLATPQLPVLGLDWAVALTGILVGLDVAMGMGVGVFVAIAKPSQVIKELLEIQISIAGSAILIAFALRHASTAWREALGLTRFSGWILPPLVLAAAGMHILISEADNTLRWVMPPPKWLIHLLESLHQTPVTTLLALVVVAPLTEEPVFRGLILGGLLRRYRARTAILVSATLFMLIHVNPYQFAVAFSFGLLAGWIYVRTRSLWPCLIAHGLLNLGPALGAINAFPWEIDGYSKSEEAGVVLFQPLWFDALGAALAALGLLCLYWMFRRRPAPIPQANA